MIDEKLLDEILQVADDCDMKDTESIKKELRKREILNPSKLEHVKFLEEQLLKAIDELESIENKWCIKDIAISLIKTCEEFVQELRDKHE